MKITVRKVDRKSYRNINIKGVKSMNSKELIEKVGEFEDTIINPYGAG